jgi:hypothetical protein
MKTTNTKTIVATLIAATFVLTSCKAPDHQSGVLENGVETTPESREEQFRQIVELVNAAMNMVPVNMEEVSETYSYLTTASKAKSCPKLGPNCEEEMIKLFQTGPEGGKSPAKEFAQLFHVDSNNQFRLALEQIATNRATKPLRTFANTVTEDQALAEATANLSRALASMPLAELTLIPTVHADANGAPACFSYAIKMRPLTQATTPAMQIVRQKYWDDQENRTLKHMDILDWKFTYAANPLPPTDPNMLQARFLIGQFNDEFAARQDLHFGILNETFGKGIEITSGADQTSPFSCNLSEGNCQLMVGKPLAPNERCAIFQNLAQ